MTCCGRGRRTFHPERCNDSDICFTLQALSILSSFLSLVVPPSSASKHSRLKRSYKVIQFQERRLTRILDCGHIVLHFRQVFVCGTWGEK